MNFSSYFMLYYKEKIYIVRLYKNCLKIFNILVLFRSKNYPYKNIMTNIKFHQVSDITILDKDY